MQLEVGMYVRSDRGKIGKFVKNVKCYFELEYQGWCDLIFKNRCLKASYNPIDLIEVGDYVNGELVSTTFEKDELSEGVLAHVVTKSGNYIFDDDIESIVTKEQFEQMSYKIGEK